MKIFSTSESQCLAPSNTPVESHQNEKDLEVVQVWDYAVEDDLKELIGITYTNKMYLLLHSLPLKNIIIKCVWLE